MENETSPKVIDSLPIQLGIRLVLDSVSYTNPLPDWLEVPQINYTAREVAIKRRVKMYLGGTPPEKPFAILLPRKAGDAKPWAMPSVNDQIVLQACVSSIAGSLFERSVNRDRVFSYRYSTSPALLSLTEDHLTSWRAFQTETRRRCSSGDCVLQLDLENAFGSIDRGRLIQFLRALFPDRLEVDLLRVLLDSFALGQPGLPLVNDSVFFLGNTYLGTVDKVIARHSSNFIRFVDDYRVFGKSLTELEGLQKAVSSDLEGQGFRINAHKMKLSTAEEYLESLAQVRYARKPTDGAVEGDVDNSLEKDYPGPAVVLTGILPPNVMVEQIGKALEHPQENLTDGRGRLLMGSLRRSRLESDVVEAHSDGKNGKPVVHDHLVGQLSQNKPILSRIDVLLKQYANQPQEMWRLTWLLYLTQNIDLKQVARPVDTALQDSLSRIRASKSTIAHLWATKVSTAEKTPSLALVEKLHDRGYVESGELLLGGKHG